MAATSVRTNLSIGARALYTIGAIAAAVALPQLFHVIGRVSLAGTAPSEAFLPMHLPIILVGMLAGPVVGLIAGVLSPLVSFLMTGMPIAGMLPFMMIELCVYGLTAGLLRGSRLPVLLQVVIVQLAGRAVRAAAILLSVYAFGYTTIDPAVIYTSITAGLFGILLQWVLIPLVMYRVEHPRG